MNKLFVFNAGHEEALRVPLKQNYTPSKEIRKIRADLASLMLYFAGEGDYVWLWANGEKADRIVNHKGEEIQDLQSLPKLELCPWALDGHLLKELGAKARLLDLDLEMLQVSEAYLKLSHRSSSLEMLRYLNEHWSRCEELYPSWFYPTGQASDREAELKSYLKEQEAKGYSELLIKRAYTSSGRGLIPLSLPTSEEDRVRILKQVQRWDGLSLEPKQKLLEDWAIEYYIDDEGEVSFVALSKFSTNSFGAYQGNVLKEQGELYDELYGLLGDDLPKLIECHKAFFREHLRAVYKGYIGVDMFVYKSKDGLPKLHPCVEINLRCTMGLVAYLVYEQKRKMILDKSENSATYQVDYLRGTWQEFQNARQGKVKLLSEVNDTTSFVAFIAWD